MRYMEIQVDKNQMEKFARHIEMIKIPPGHPAPNNVETCMKPLGKAMKAGFRNKVPEQKVLKDVLKSYRDRYSSS